MLKPVELGRPFPWHLATVAGVILVSVFFNLGSYRTLGSHETYAAAPARSMLESGDWVIPRIGQEPRLRKPPLVYWMIAVSGHVFDGVNEWTARFPQAISGIALTILIAVWATRRGGYPAGVFAALVQGTTIYFVTFSRKAEIDMFQCLCTTMALFVIASGSNDRTLWRQRMRWVVVYALISMTWLAKFHYGAAMVLGPTVLWMLAMGEWRRLKCFLNPFGLILLFAAVGIWPWLLLQQIPDAWTVWKTQTIGRAIGQMESQPFWYYLPHLAWLTMPWTPMIVLAIPRSWKKAWRESDSQERFLWFWFLTDLAICTISANKHAHYLLAALPMLSLIAGDELALRVARLRENPHWLPMSRAMGWSAVVVISTGFAIWLCIRKYPYLSTSAAVAGLSLAAGSVSALLLAAAGRNRSAGYILLAAFAGCQLSVYGWILPVYDHRLAAREFSRESRMMLGEETEICAYRMDLTAVEFYLGRRCQRLESISQFERYMSNNPGLPIFLVAYETDLKTFEQSGKVQMLSHMKQLPDQAPTRHPPLVLARIVPPGSSWNLRSAEQPDSNGNSRETL